MTDYDNVASGSETSSTGVTEHGIKEQGRLLIYKGISHTASFGSLQESPPHTNGLNREYGSFKDSLRAPVHRWFTYPAGYSYRFVEAKIKEYGLTAGSTIGDPFLGTGTTSLAARMLGIHSVGVEAHRFVHWVAQTKLFLNHDLNSLSATIGSTVDHANEMMGKIDYTNIWPDLVYRCFSEENLSALAALRQAILDSDAKPEERDFLKLALTTTLRIVTSAGAGWPYIAPSKYQEKKVHRPALPQFESRCWLMYSDLQHIRSLSLPFSSHEVLLGDARKFDEYAGREAVDLIVTSPPYLNNYDYADRTRLETYFWGDYTSWGEITREIRDHLMMAATTQVSMSAMRKVLECPNVSRADSQVHADLMDIISKLSQMRLIKNGKKTYDYMAAGYFEDICEVLTSTYSVLKQGSKFVLVIGDSAPYGVHIPTEEIIGRLAVAIGYTAYSTEQLRTRGGKWGHNPQRHGVPLKESVLTIAK